MRPALVLIALALFLGGIAVNLVSDDINELFSERFGSGYRVAIYIAFAVALILNVWSFGKDRASQAGLSSSASSRDEFKAIWRAFSTALRNDLTMSLRSAELARLRAKDREPHPGLQVHSPDTKTQFSVHHHKAIASYDNEFGRLVDRYIRACEVLRAKVNTYNQLGYANLLEGQEFELESRMERSTEYQIAKDEMYRASRELEDAIDELTLKADYYSDIHSS